MKFLDSNNFFVYTLNALWSDISGHELITSIGGLLIIQEYEFMGAPEIIILIVLFLILSVMFFFGRKAFIWLSRYLKKLDGLQDSIDDLNRKI